MPEPGGSERRSRIDPYLATWNVPRPVKLAIAAVVWPIMGVMVLLSGASALALGLLAVVLVLSLIYVLGAGGVQGFAYLADRPLSVVPHSLATGLALLVALPLSLWWVRNLVRVWRAEDERKPAGIYASPWAPPADAHDASEGWTERAVNTARNGTAIIAWLIFLWMLGQAQLPVAANDPAAGILVIALVAIVGGLAYIRLVNRVGDNRQAWVAAPIVLLLAALALGVYGGIQDRSSGQLRRYCEYGAVSRAQLGGCLDHVTNAEINRLQTDAARFSRGDLWQCLADSGPFCASRLASMEAAQNEPDQ